MTDMDGSAKSEPTRDIFGKLWPVWPVRTVAVTLGMLALILPWVAGSLGWLKAEGKANEKPVQWRSELMILPDGPKEGFAMGSPEAEKSREADEVQHLAKVSSFMICTTEVTRGQWKAVMGAEPKDCTDGCSDEHPVQNMSWAEALDYMNKLTERENSLLEDKKKLTKCYENKGGWIWLRTCTGYRLPTETEWEYAARAGTETAFSFGDNESAARRYANVRDAWDDGFPNLAPVAQFQPNSWGLYDMHGNVQEWVWDNYAPYPATSEADYAGPEKTNDNKRISRGGHFGATAAESRSAMRSKDNTPEQKYLGARCARNSPQPEPSP